MDILIPDEWLRNFLKTKATPKKIAEYLSLSGPSVDKVIKEKGSDVYQIEITTNRVDTASVYGIAREANAILPRFKIKASLAKAVKKTGLGFTKKVGYLNAVVDKNLCPRFTAVLIKNVQIKKSLKWMEERLLWVGVRPINNVVDISNYIMHELGQPVHTFDYDKIVGSKMILRKSRKGEKITTLDGQTHELPGDDIVIEDGSGKLIDLAGIMGGENSAVDKNTKNVLLFVQNYNPLNIRKTSMNLAKRTEAAELFEKGLDPEMVTLGIGRGIELFEKLAGGRASAKILDIYPSPYKAKRVTVKLSYVEKILNVTLKKSEVTKMLQSLNFEVSWKKDELTAFVPSFRADDINIGEDLIEEIARIYGYFNLPSKLMEGKLPEKVKNSPFDFEMQVKEILKGFGGNEVYTLSLVPKSFTDGNTLKLKNPLGKESEYLRTSLRPSLVAAAKQNSGEKDPFFMFEMSNIYLPRKDKLPDEQMTLGVVFANYEYRKAKGILEALLISLNADAGFEAEDSKYFSPSKRLVVKSQGSKIGEFGILENTKLIYFEFNMQKLKNSYRQIKPYKPIPKYPAQIEDLTLVLPEKTKVGDIISETIKTDKKIKKAELRDTYKDAYTFRIWYRDLSKTLTNKDVEKIRNKVLSTLSKKFGVRVKD